MDIMRIEAKSILIRSTNWIGDVVISLPSVKAIRQLYPDSKITVLCRPYLKEIYSNIDIIDSVMSIENGSLPALYKAARDIRKQGFDMGVLLQNAINGALLFYFCRIDHRIGYATDGRGILLNHKPKDDFKDSHQMERYIGIAKYLGFNGDTPSPFIKTPFDMHIKNKGFLYGLLSKKLKTTIKEAGHIIVIAPGAKYGTAKIWGEGNFSRLIERLSEIKDILILLIGSGEDYELSQRIIKNSSSKNNVYNVCGLFSIMESLYIMGESDMVVSNDSGAMHLASARNTNITAIFGPTSFSQTQPISNKTRLFFSRVECWPCRHRVCPKSRHLCMEQISPDEVFEFIKKKIGAN